MKIKIGTATLNGMAEGISSKSDAHRLLIAASLADGETKLHLRGTSADILATQNCLMALGAQISYKEDTMTILPVDKKKVKTIPLLDCKESGSTLRFLLPVAAALGVEATFHMEGRLPQRPLFPLDRELEAHGAALTRPTDTTLTVSGRLTPGDYHLPGDVSSQYISGLLFALPLLAGPSTLTVSGPIESAPYLQLTEAALRQFGVAPQWHPPVYDLAPGRYHSPGAAAVEGDWSNAAFFLAAGATVTGLDLQSRQGDRAILWLLQRFGAAVAQYEDTAAVELGKLTAQDIDAAAIPDLVPVLAVLAANAQGTSRIYNAARLRLKESDRLSTVAALLRNLGGKVEITADGLTIEGTGLTGGVVDSYFDHRIAMAAAVAATSAHGPVVLRNAQAVEKSYPGFWADFQALGGKLR